MITPLPSLVVQPLSAALTGRAATFAAGMGAPLLGPLEAGNDLDAVAIANAEAAAGLALEGETYRWFLTVGNDGLTLRWREGRRWQILRADFCSGRTEYRRRRGGGAGQHLARAIGVRSGIRPTVLDTTAGMGGDAFALACLGCRVTMVERHPLVAALVADGLERAALDSEAGPIVRERLTLVHADARDMMTRLASIGGRPDVIYLDPMFPRAVKKGGRRTAASRKDMAVCHELVGGDEDAPVLLELALTRAIRRVVVKRPRLAESLAGPRPAGAITGRSTRFDIYTPLAE